MNILVTGGTGFLGQHLALRLQSLGHHVSVLGRNQKIGKQLEAEGFKFLPIDLRDKEATVTACQGQDSVFHCAALSSPWGKYRDFYDSNVVATRHIIQGCQEWGVKRLIHVSTPSIYFNFCHRFNIRENDPLPKIPANAYAETKLLAEQEIDRAHQQGFPVITIRPRSIVGPGDTAIFPRLLQASSRIGIPLINQGKACIDVTYVDNVVDALLLCQNAPDTSLGKKFNITNGQPIELRNLLEMLSQQLGYPLKFTPYPYKIANLAATAMEFFSKSILFGKEPVLTRYKVGVLAFSQTLDITAARTELGYQPRVSLEEGLKIFAQWWKGTKDKNS
ncbi:MULTISPECIES: NAD-dependent epimerase/dehydratase family protein [Nostocales]|uniref:3-beta hydroxysteroid dehydrogenase n=3 Tax=Nostocales TaxID=1161 RepID=A0A0C1NAC0_9CYAN|nr:NAD(P)-dependent oxidoreductase [Tolypothrix bouteillei]KAF3887521.1 NAD(P)-dependent oxidoreductase [Tolypothrix bouteillei VB521301]